MKITSLESYVKNSLGSVPGAKSYERYVKENGGDYKKSYFKGVGNALKKYRSKLSGYGSLAENIAADGLTGGYSERVNRLAREELDGNLDYLGEQKDAKESQLLTGYSKYLESVKKQREALKQNIANRLIGEEILNSEALYSYGIGAGLTESEATEVRDSVYNALRLKIMGEILSQVAALNLDPERAILLATDRGLNTEDVNTVRKKALEYYSPTYADDAYLDYLESIGNKNTSTFN